MLRRTLSSAPSKTNTSGKVSDGSYEHIVRRALRQPPPSQNMDLDLLATPAPPPERPCRSENRLEIGQANVATREYVPVGTADCGTPV